MRHYDRKYRRWKSARADYKRARRQEFVQLYQTLYDALRPYGGGMILLLLVLNAIKPTVRALWLRLQMDRWDSVNPPPMP